MLVDYFVAFFDIFWSWARVWCLQLCLTQLMPLPRMVDNWLVYRASSTSPLSVLIFLLLSLCLESKLRLSSAVLQECLFPLRFSHFIMLENQIYPLYTVKPAPPLEENAQTSSNSQPTNSVYTAPGRWRNVLVSSPQKWQGSIMEQTSTQHSPCNLSPHTLTDE